MIINKLNIINLRNHIDSHLEFSPKLNVFYGPNGSGKTSILEAISICGFTKSFLPTNDLNLIRFGENSYRISLHSTNYLNSEYHINIEFLNNIKNKKLIKSTFGNNISPKEVIGELPQVILSPDFKIITFGSPQDRRSFIDRLLSQLSKSYYEDLLKLKKILKQRNELLSNVESDNNFDRGTFEILTNMLVDVSKNIIFKRAEFINEIIPIYKKYYKFITENKEFVDIKYFLSGKAVDNNILTDKTLLLEYINSEFSRLENAEIRRGLTLFGPQKDDIEFIINNGLAKEIASQGQHKSILISLKFAELEYLKFSKAEIPVILLDDIFSELDELRISKVFELIEHLDSQAFITVTETNILKNVISNYKSVSYFKISDGTILKEN